MTRKERALAAMRGEKVDRVPAGFWFHYPAQSFHGQPCINAHVDFCKRTKTDILKIMNENLYRSDVPILTAKDFKHIKPLDIKHPLIQDQLDIVKGVVDACGDEVAIVATIFATVASAFYNYKFSYLDKYPKANNDFIEIGKYLVMFLREEPEIVSNAFKICGESMAQLAEMCVDAGADGIYTSILGAEKFFFTDEEYEKYIMPYDKAIFQAANKPGKHNVLHICKDNMADYRFKDFPADVFNWGVFSGGNPPLEAGRELWPGKTLLGGLDDRDGVMVYGSLDEIKQSVFGVLDSMGQEKFILGADCTLPGDIAFERINAAVDACEEYAASHK